MTKGIFGDLFDLNNDGRLDIFEQAAEYSFLNQIMNEDRNKDEDEFEDDEFEDEDF